MKFRANRSMSGPFGYVRKGDVFDAEAARGRELVELGYAVEVTADGEEKAPKASAKTAEKE